jgi:hypothetical protein
MKKAYVFAVLLLVQFLLSSCAGRNANMKSFQDLCPEKKVGICSFTLGGAGSNAEKVATAQVLGGLAGGLIAVAIYSGKEEDPYYQELANAFYHIYEEELGKSGFFQVTSPKNLIFQQDGKRLNMNDMANRNNLYACVNVGSFLTYGGGVKKYMRVMTWWEITKSSGEKLKFTTQVTSDDAQEFFANKTDPKFKPVFLELARQSAQQFLVVLGEGGETGSCLKASLEKKKALEEKQQEIEKAALKAKDDSRFVNKGNGTVLDTKTGLTWAAKDNGSNIKWADAKSYCENYRGGGYTDWRLPTTAELESLYHAGRERPVACDKSCSIHVATDLIDITCYYLWTSETRKSLILDPDAAYFYFLYGGQYWGRQSGSQTYRVLPVRSDKQSNAVSAAEPVIQQAPLKTAPTLVEPVTPPAVEKARDGRFIAYDNGTVLDTQMNLMWAAKDNGTNISWANAKSYCDNYRGGGYRDWRMPTSAELEGLYDVDKTYMSDCGQNVHLTKLILLTCVGSWASLTRDSTASAASFRFVDGRRIWGRQSSDSHFRILPVRSVK